MLKSILSNPLWRKRANQVTGEAAEDIRQANAFVAKSGGFSIDEFHKLLQGFNSFFNGRPLDVEK